MVMPTVAELVEIVVAGCKLTVGTIASPTMTGSVNVVSLPQAFDSVAFAVNVPVVEYVWLTVVPVVAVVLPLPKSQTTRSTVPLLPLIEKSTFRC